MHLPNGVVHRPRQRELIAKDSPAVIEITTANRADNAGYEIKPRFFASAIAPYLHGDWADLDRTFRLENYRTINVDGRPVDLPIMYGGAEHRGTPKLPNITVVPNFQVGEVRGVSRPFSVLGSTMGHWHLETAGGPRIQEVYEFQSHGLLVIDREDGHVELWVGRDGDKVSVPSACHMTLYNLGDQDEPLVTLDFADPDRNLSTKTTIEQLGPILLGRYDDVEVVFTLNRLYISNSQHRGGVRLPTIPEAVQDRQVRIARGGRLALGAFLYEQFTENLDLVGRCAELGLRVKKASPEAAVWPLPDSRGASLHFSRSLVDAVRTGSDVHAYFGNDDDANDRNKGQARRRDSAPGRADSIGMVRRQSQAASHKEKLGRAKLPGSQRVVFVVEGAGSWVTDTYRPVFNTFAAGRPMTVIYADDTRWTAAPEWTSRLHAHEVYLDKSHPDDFALYRTLHPDLVFVATPDFMHCETARWWVSRAAPLVFVEKPFDSDPKNVDTLFNALGRKPVTTVLGLDHYRFRALEIQRMLPGIVRHLDGALASVAFYMTEMQPLELKRVRTLQFGLTMDLLPHFLALLAFFGDVGTVDDIRILDAGRYGPRLIATGCYDSENPIEEDVSARFLNETYSKVRFTFEDYSGNGYRVPCTAVVGKGFKATTKFLEVTGRNGHAVRVDFSGRPNPDPAPGYPWGSIMLLLGEHATEATRIRLADPHKIDRELRIGTGEQPIEQSRERYYQALIEDLTNGTTTSFAATLLPDEAWETVRALNRIWQALQAFRDAPGWSTQLLQQTDPLDL